MIHGFALVFLDEASGKQAMTCGGEEDLNKYLTLAEERDLFKAFKEMLTCFRSLAELVGNRRITRLFM